MMEMIVHIMVEVLSILGIAMKEIKQGRMSEQFTSIMSPLTERCSEKYGKKLVGKTDLEDALKRLDNLTQEEARMAAVEVLRATRIIDERLRGVSKQVLVVDDMEQTANDLDHLKRSSSPDSSEPTTESHTVIQKTNCETMFTNGCLHRIHQRTIT
jgi:hypothetical protein